MTWIVAESPTIAAISEHVYVVRTNIEFMPDEVNYEAIVGDRFNKISLLAGKITDSVIVLTTPLGFEMLKDISKNAAQLGPKKLAALIGAAMRDHQAVVMRWQ